MTGCCGDTSCGIGRCFSHFSRRYVRRYERHGLETTQKQLVAGLLAAGFDGRTLLEVGCGVGYLHQYLLLRGAATAVGVDLSETMLSEARGLAERQGLAGRTRYMEGDFRLMASELEAADITVLDKVVCCYPDAAGLLAATVGRTKESCALTLPRRHVVNRVASRLGASLLRIVGSAYRPYIHDPVLIDQWMREAGFERILENHTLFWLTCVYRRVAAS
ncbi:MAG: class I SAM-dependent methyltransferase [Acidiferrobacter sp.]